MFRRQPKWRPGYRRDEAKDWREGKVREESREDGSPRGMNREGCEAYWEGYFPTLPPRRKGSRRSQPIDFDSLTFATPQSPRSFGSFGWVGLGEPCSQAAHIPNNSNEQCRGICFSNVVDEHECLRGTIT